MIDRDSKPEKERYRQKGDTAPLVASFIEHCKNIEYRDLISHQLIPFTNNCIRSFCKQDFEGFFQSIKNLSEFQYQYFEDKIPSGFHELWKTGIDSNKFWLKLCGSGGGGYLLGFTKNTVETELFLSKMGFSYHRIDFNLTT